MNRFDGIIEFSALSKENLLTIVDLMLDNVNQRLANNGIHLRCNWEKLRKNWLTLVTILRWVLDHYVRTIQDHIEDAITDFYLENPNEKDLKQVMNFKRPHQPLSLLKKSKKLLKKLRQQKNLIKQINQVITTWFIYLFISYFQIYP